VVMLLNTLVVDFQTDTLINCWKDANFVYTIRKLCNLYFDEKFCGQKAVLSSDEEALFEWIYVLLKNLLTQSSLCVHFQKNESIVAKIWRLIDEKQSVPEPENNQSTNLELSKLQNKKKTAFSLLFTQRLSKND